MNKKIFLNIVSFVCIALMFLKVSSLHAYTHQDDTDKIESCTVCDVAIENQQAEYLETKKLSLDFVALPAFEVQPLFKSAQTFSASFLDERPFCRPPPSLV